MEKIIDPSSWDFGVPTASLVKFSGNGLSGDDLGVLVKRAGAEFANEIKNISVGKGQVPVHLIAMGSTEGYGPNRNGDGFKEAALEQYHDTFVKYAKHYRHHKNKDPDKSYGSVKASFYNKPMKRVELLVALNSTKEAADKHGGFVADSELEKLNKGDDLAVSMACKVAYDVCSNCGNRAANRDQYCTDDGCVGTAGEKRGGCKHNLTKLSSDGHILHVDNPHPTFFDISTVFRPADRIAYGNVVDYMNKAASGEVLGGAALAEAWGVTPPANVALIGIQDSNVANQIKLAYKLAAAEDSLNNLRSREELQIARAFGSGIQGSMDLDPLGEFGSTKFAAGLSALASQKVVIPFKDFLKLEVSETSEKYASLVESVPRHLFGVYNRLISSPSLESQIRANPYAPAQKLASTPQRLWANKLAEDFSLNRDSVHRRMQISAIRNLSLSPALQPLEMTKEASSSEAEAYARRYALYKLAFLSTVKDDITLTAEMVIRQNQVI
jgi:hypothetical protein